MPFILDSIVFRLFALYSHYEPVPVLQGLRGFLSDAIQCLPFLLVYSTAPNKYLKAAAFIVFSAVISANTEHILVNHGHINYESIGFILDRQFLIGSALSARAMALFLSSCLLLISVHLSSGRLRAASAMLPRRFRVRAPLRWLCVIILTGSIPISVFNAGWQQQSFLEQNVSSFLYRDKQRIKPYAKAASRPGFDDGTGNSGYHWVNPYEVQAGTSLLNESAPEKNVLFILIEGLSQHQVADNTLKQLKTLGEENFTASHFINAQRQTNRGLYTLFCGKYPNLVSRIAKADIVGLSGSDTLCLPEILKQHGYETVFLQSTDLSFMRFDRFMDHIGFRQIIGNPDWIEPGLRTEWGIDDLTLYESALHKIGELNRQKKQWFMSLLTVSTHHPYNIPDARVDRASFGFPGTGETHTFHDALRFADEAVASFIKKLKEAHILDDTLVIIMSDEANGTGNIRSGKPETANSNFLSNNHGPFIALGRRIPKGARQDRVFSQVDVPATTLDYLNIEHPHPIGGRSLFRTYASDKRIFFGNVYSDIFGYFEGVHRVVLCGLNLTCSSLHFDHDALSGNRFQYSSQAPADSTTIDQIKKVIDINDIFSSGFSGGSLILEKDRTYQGQLYYELTSKFKIDGGLGKPVKIAFAIDNTLSAKGEDLSVEIQLECFKSRDKFSNHVIVPAGKSKSFVKDILLNDNEEYALDINVETLNTDPWKVDRIQIHY
ncbi:MAG: LTA synthase family protein [Gammaproteobacteria bacterium]